MANKIQIHRRVAPGAVGSPGTLAPGELAYNQNGLVAGDANMLVIGGASTIETLVSNQRQVELTGDQIAAGNKTFRNLIFGGVGTENTLPTIRPTVNGQVLTGTTAGVVSWVTPSGTVNERYIIAGAGATVEAAFNAQAITVTAEDIVVYQYQDQAFLYTGPAGAPVAGATAGQFGLLGITNVTYSAQVNTGGAASGANVVTITEPTNASVDFDFLTNQANGLLQLGATGLIPLALMPVTAMVFKGGHDASGGALPAGAPVTGWFYIISVAGNLSLLNATGGAVVAGTAVNPGDAIIWDAAAAGGAYWHIPAATNVGAQTAAQTPSVAVGDVAATDVQAAIAELDTEKLAKTPTANQTLTGIGTGVHTLLSASTGVITGSVTVPNQIDLCLFDMGVY